MNSSGRINNLPVDHAEQVNEDSKALEYVEGMAVTIYAWPSSQACMGCVHSVFIERNQLPLCNSHYICLIGSCNNHSANCSDRR
jgi:hypothetical protein